MKVSLEERFWAKVEKTDGCWIWNGGKASLGYGRIYVDGKSRPAHRVAWELFHGEAMPEHLDACHHCDNPLCVRPDHIFPGTPSENARDALAKGRPLGPRRLTHCKRGHSLEGENVYVSPNNGLRACRECRRERSRVWNRRKAATRIALTASGGGDDAS